MKKEQAEHEGLLRILERSRLARTHQVADRKVYTSWKQVPSDLKTRSQWRDEARDVRRGEKPAAIFQWREAAVQHSDVDLPGGSKVQFSNRSFSGESVHLFDEHQTRPYKARPKTAARHSVWKLFRRSASKDNHLWWSEPRADWVTCSGRLQESHFNQHVVGKEIYGILAGSQTHFGLIDLDLHHGDPAIFLAQFKVLLDEFHGHDGWHFQVAQENAGGVHLSQVFSEPRWTNEYTRELRERLRKLDAPHPELAERAHRARMRSIAELEIYPHPTQGVRLPLCRGRTMLLDKPLGLIYDKQRKDYVPDVEKYICWVNQPSAYMPAKAVYKYVKERLVTPGAESKVAAKKQPKAPRPSGVPALGPLKGRFTQFLIDYWTGAHNPPDSLNTAIRLLSLVLPFYLSSEQQAVSLIEKYIDELPCWTFSDRLSSGNRKEVSRIVQSTVRHAFNGFGGQDDPELSKKKLTKTVEAWKRKGFSPVDKSTWKTICIKSSKTSFCWTPREIHDLLSLKDILKTDLHTTSKVVKHFVTLVKSHPGECSVGFVKQVLEGVGIACGHNGKANQFLAALTQLDWIYVRVSERPPIRHLDGSITTGRARAYGVGEELVHKFEESNTNTVNHEASKNECYELPPASIIASHRKMQFDGASVHEGHQRMKNTRGSPGWSEILARNEPFAVMAE